MEERSGRCMILHVDLIVKSMAASLDFYCGKLGFKLVEDTVVNGPLVEYLSSGQHTTARLVFLRVSKTGAMIELQELREDLAVAIGCAEMPVLRGLVSILVPDLDGQIANVRDRGLVPASAIFQVSLPKLGNSRVVFYEDPDGNRIEFLELRQRSHEG